MALGAQPGRVIGMIMREAGALLALGVGIALPAYFGLARFVKSQLYSIDTNDAATIAAAVLLLSSVALLGGHIPARKAAWVDPIQVLRHQ